MTGNGETPGDQAASTDGGESGMTAGECPNRHVTYPPHPTCPECGERQDRTRDLTDHTATVVTWTENTATPPGVRTPNTLAIVEFDLGDASVRAIGQVAENADVETGDRVRPVYADQLRDPEAGIRHPDSQEWDGYRFEPVEME